MIHTPNNTKLYKTHTYTHTSLFLPKALLISVSAVIGRAGRGLVLVVEGQVIENFAHALEGDHVVLEGAVCHAYDG